MQTKGRVKRRDKFAMALRDPKYRKRVVKSARTYNRKARPAPEAEIDS
jgi:hypothetical protein